MRLPHPVNKFPDFVAYLLQRLKTLSPSMGKVKIAQTLARAGLHLGATTIGRMLKRPPARQPQISPRPQSGSGPGVRTAERIVTANYPGHVWHVDLTVVPTGGFWTSWVPFALPQVWPFCYWVAIVIDHLSRRVMGATAFKAQPNCAAVCSFLGRAIAKAPKGPRTWYVTAARSSTVLPSENGASGKASGIRAMGPSASMVRSPSSNASSSP